MARLPGTAATVRLTLSPGHTRQVKRLRQEAIHVTRQRISALDALERHPHSDATMVKALINDGIGSISTQAVYDVLAALVRAGLVRKIEPAGMSALFELNRPDKHQHVICRTCKKLADVACAGRRAPCPSTADIDGFAVDEAEVTYWGTCTACIRNSVAWWWIGRAANAIRRVLICRVTSNPLRVLCGNSFD
ncbi:MAG: Fur family transcriptional regulator [Rhodococcus sp. (in: high G+C Gram-positive bacteria)]